MSLLLKNRPRYGQNCIGIKIAIFCVLVKKIHNFLQKRKNTKLVIFKRERSSAHASRDCFFIFKNFEFFSRTLRFLFFSRTLTFFRQFALGPLFFVTCFSNILQHLAPSRTCSKYQPPFASIQKQLLLALYLQIPNSSSSKQLQTFSNVQPLIAFSPQ